MRGAALDPSIPLYSPDGRTRFLLQPDGNMVVYSSGMRALWNSGTQGRGGTRLVMQIDGNLVLYTTSNAPVWQSGTPGRDASVLVMQSDGNLVLYGQLPVWASFSNGYTLRQNERLSPGQSLTAADGGSVLSMQEDGNLVVYLDDAPRWASATAGTVGAYVILQPDGNLVLYAAQKALWASFGLGAQIVMIANSGLVASRTALDDVATWSTWTGRNQLVREWRLSGGDSVASADRGYELRMQLDGNLVLVSRGGTVIWHAHTYGNAGAYATIELSGEFVILSAAGRRLWQTLPSSDQAKYLAVQNDGNLVTYDGTGRASWSLVYSPSFLVDYPNQTSPPRTSVSRYIRNLRADSTDAVLMRQAGCADAKANVSGARYLIVLAVGAQYVDSSFQWGVLLTTTSIAIPNDTLVFALTAYINAYVECRSSDTQTTIAIGTSNDSSSDQARGAAGGTVFARSIIEPLRAFTSEILGVTIAGANDIEPGFRGTQPEALAWTTAYLGATIAPYVFFGSADGCAYQQLGTVNSSCNHGYTQYGLYQLAFGLDPSRMLPLPQMYFSSSMPTQWTNISLTGARNGRSAIAFAGPLTETIACAQAGSCTSLDPIAAWIALWKMLNSLAETAIEEMPYATDLRIDYR
jgi:hypothetical protein